MLVPLEIIIKIIYRMTALHHWLEGSTYIRYRLLGFLYKKNAFWKREIFKILKNLNLHLFFLCLGCLLSDLQFCDFSKNKSCKTYGGPMLPCGGRNWQLIDPNHRRAKVFMMTNTRAYCSELLIIFIIIILLLLFGQSSFLTMIRPGNTHWRERANTVDLLIKVACFCKKVMFTMPKAADLNEQVQGGQLYWAFHFSKGSLVRPIK